MVIIATTTFYCHCARCNGKAYQPTASGVMPRDGVTVAAPTWVKFGTILHIEGIGVRIVQDRMSRRFPDRLDVFVHTGRGLRADHKLALKLGKKDRRITILKLEALRSGVIQCREAGVACYVKQDSSERVSERLL
jgi:3D (Asp-Asp-Asp) domain-containing protein